MVFKCKMCGGTLEVTEGASVAECPYCGAKQTLPKLDNERRANLYDRAGHFRRMSDFDKAMALYEEILKEDSTDAEAYWSIVLCRYGIEYVEDPATHKRIPTVNRMQLTSVLADEDYKSALAYADAGQRELYETEAKEIEEIQKGILAISEKEEPFDVFICYKETDDRGVRTRDSVLANDLYYELTNEGYKVFFSRITLEDKLGTAYEPYIFAALRSARVMVVVGTKPEYLNSPWVKNEWSRYLALIRAGEKKTLIPAYRDMDPYDLPDAFSHLQAQDMSKLGFMQDLTRGIRKLLGEKGESISAGEIPPALKRAMLFLEDEDWDRADRYCENALDNDPECGYAYLVKLLIDLHLHSENELLLCSETFDNNPNYRKAVRFDKAIKERLSGYISQIEARQRGAAMSSETDHLQDGEAEAGGSLGYPNEGALFADTEIDINERISQFKERLDNAQLSDTCRFLIRTCNFGEDEGIQELLLEAQQKCERLEANENAIFTDETIEAIFVIAEEENGLAIHGVKTEHLRKYNHGAIVLPDRICGKRITRICRSTYGGGYTDITALAIPGGVQVEAEAFSGCNKLVEMVIGRTDGECEIGAHCFDNCINLRSACLSAEVTNIGLGAFAGCWRLGTLVVSPENINYYVGTSGCVEKQTNTLLFGVNTKRVIVGRTIRQIGDYAFYNCSAIENIWLPEGIKAVGYAAFSGCAGIKNIVLPSSVEYIDAFAFDGCKQLRTVETAKKTGWYISMGDDEEDTVVLSNPEHNAEMLTNQYVEYQWKRK